MARPWIFRVCPVFLHFGTHILLSSKVDKGFANESGRSDGRSGVGVGVGVGLGTRSLGVRVCHFVK